MEKTITVSELITKYNELNNAASKEAFLNASIKGVNYMTTPMVDGLATQIVNSSSFDEEGNLKIDSFRRYFLFIITLIDSYTNIDIDTKNVTLEYDNLKENELIDIIINHIPEDCVITLQTAIDMKVDDLLTNYQMKRMDKISMMPEKTIMFLSDILEKYSEQIGNIDWEKVLQNNENNE